MGARCQECGQDMSKATTCPYKFVLINGKWYKRNTSYYDYNKRCHDCGIVNHGGHVHHYGCDIERCPRCKGQMIACGCHQEVELAISKPTHSKTNKHPFSGTEPRV